MIHTDGNPTIANCGPVPGLEQEERRLRVARDIAAAYAISLEEAVFILTHASRPRGVSPELHEMLLSDDPALD